MLREFEANLVEVATFDANDEMTIKRLPREKVSTEHKVIECDTPLVFNLSNSVSGEKFIKNLERVNKQRAEQHLGAEESSNSVSLIPK